MALSNIGLSKSSQRQLEDSSSKSTSLLMKQLEDNGPGVLLKMDTFISILMNTDLDPMNSIAQLLILSVKVHTFSSL